TATELAALADIGASSASGHFARLREQGLVEMLVQGRHRYYRLTNAQVAQALEALLLLTQHSAAPFKPNTPSALRQARTCYDHCAGEVAVKLHDALLNALGIDVDAVRQQRRRLAYACLDWSERAPHIGGALGAALLELMLTRGWVSRHLDSRALKLTAKGVGGMAKVFGV
ncbi:ArsR/SmtB family transcription factor, partial [Pseudomonas savastanoi]